LITELLEAESTEWFPIGQCLTEETYNKGETEDSEGMDKVKAKIKGIKSELSELNKLSSKYEQNKGQNNDEGNEK